MRWKSSQVSARQRKNGACRKANDTPRTYSTTPPFMCTRCKGAPLLRRPRGRDRRQSSWVTPCVVAVVDGAAKPSSRLASIGVSARVGADHPALLETATENSEENHKNANSRGRKRCLLAAFWQSWFDMIVYLIILLFFGCVACRR